jgi:hypothetical protein
VIVCDARKVTKSMATQLSPAERDAGVEALALKRALLILVSTASTPGVAAVALLEATAELICISTKPSNRAWARAQMLEQLGTIFDMHAAGEAD